MLFYLSGEDEKEKKKRLKEEERRKKEADEKDAEIQEIPTVVAKETILTPLQEWESSLMSSTSYAQLFIHLTTLDSSIIWSK